MEEIKTNASAKRSFADGGLKGRDNEVASPLPIPLIIDDEDKVVIPHHHEFLKSHTFERCLIIGPSGSGKSYSLLFLLPKFATPTNLWLLLGNPNQSIYKSIAKYYSDLGTNVVLLKSVKDLQKIPKDLSHTVYNTVVIDDIDKDTLDDKKIVSLFTTGRHRKISTFLLVQNLFSVPTTIRKNLTSAIFFKQSSDITSVLKEIKAFVDKKMFLKYYDTLKGYDFLFIDLMPKIEVLRIRRNFDEIDETQLES
jgi:ABC-type iron transport system FetAB ATPase subunit